MRTVLFSGSRMLPQAGNSHVRLHSELRIVKAKERKLARDSGIPKEEAEVQGRGPRDIWGKGM